MKRAQPIRIRDADGLVWTVRAERRRSVVLSLDQPARSERRDLVLVFTSEFGEVRRTPESVPADWATRPPAELAALLAHATRVGSVRPRR